MKFRSLLIAVMILGLAAALLAEKRFTRSREQAAKHAAAATSTVKARQAKAATIDPVFQGEPETAQRDDHFAYRNLVDLPGQRVPDTRLPLIIPRPSVDNRPSGESTSSPTEMEQSVVALEVAPLLRTAVIPASSAFHRGSKAERDQDETRESGRQQNEAASQRRFDEGKTDRKPREEHLTKAHDFNGDLRSLPYKKPVRRERRELEGPELNPRFYVPPGGSAPEAQSSSAMAPSIPQINAPAPAPLNVFEGLDRFNWGAGSPPDPNGDAGPTYYIQTVNTSIGIFRKSDGFREAATTFDTFMSQGQFGNLCDTNNFGDPVVVYDTFEDRWIITDFAFQLDGGGNVLAPAYQCIAASKSGDPINGGWGLFLIYLTDNFSEFSQFCIWSYWLFISGNMFSFGAGSTFQNARVWAFNKSQMYAGSPTVKVVSFDVPGGDFTVIPSNARLQTGTPPAGRPNLFISTELFLNALTVYKFH